MKVYFTCSIRGSSKYWENYLKIYDLIKEMGHSHLGNDGLGTKEHQIYDQYGLDMEQHNKRTMAKIHMADVVVIEVSVHSLSMGYVMHAALSLGKPVIALHVKDMRPAFVEGIKTDKLQLLEYSMSNIDEVLKDALKIAAEETETRFTMLIDGEVREKLNQVAASGRSRSQYIRELILSDI